MLVIASEYSMKGRVVMEEKDLYEPVKNWLYTKVGCTDVYAEVWDVDVLGIQGVCNVRFRALYVYCGSNVKISM